MTDEVMNHARNCGEITILQSELQNAKCALAALKAGMAGAAEQVLAENAKLREALAVYADPHSWTGLVLSGDQREFLSDEYDHGYELAQKCLEET